MSVHRVIPHLILALLTAFWFGACRQSGERLESPRAFPSDSSHADIFLDFETPDIGTWSRLERDFASDSLPLEWAAVDGRDYNRSRGSIHLFTRGGRESGSTSFMFRDNGLDPVPIKKMTRVAWNWKVYTLDDSNGFWLVLWIRDTRSGRLEQVRAVNWVRTQHDVLMISCDAPQAWAYHEEPLHDFIAMRWGPFSPGDLVLEGIGLGFARSRNNDAWVDNIWVGEGRPDDSVNVVEPSRRSRSEIPRRMSGVSFDFLDLDNVPDRVDIYTDRAEIFLNPHTTPRDGLADSFGVAVEDKAIFQTIDFKTLRGQGFASSGDFDHDGASDILLSFVDRLGNVLYLNRYVRSGRFTPAAVDETLRCVEQEFSGSAVADVDNDGDLDILLVSPFCRTGKFGGVRLLKAESGRFVDFTDESGILSEGASGASFADVDGDGDQDLFIAYKWYYDDPDSVGIVPHLYINDGTGRFTAGGDRLILDPRLMIKGGVFSDFDNDGDLDLYVVASEYRSRPGLSEQPGNRLFLNDGTGRFTDVTAAAGVESPVPGVCALAADFDLDGDSDLYVMNAEPPCIMYWNDGAAHFQADSMPGDFQCRDRVKGGVAVDFDSDGDCDIVLVRAEEGDLKYLENARVGASSIAVRARGVRNNAGAVGARVYLYEPGYVGDAARLIGSREIHGGNGFGYGVPPIAHFGLGARRFADLRVVFPPVDGGDPVVVERTGVPAGSLVDIAETGTAFEKIARGPLLEGAKRKAARAFFAIPAWLVSIVVFSSIAALGIRIRNAAGGRGKLASALFCSVLVVLLSAALVIHGWTWGIPVACCALAAIFFGNRLEAIARRVFYRRAYREKLIEMLLRELSEFLHTRGDYDFLRYLSWGDEGQLADHRESFRQDFERLDKLVDLMKLCTPEDARWRRAGRYVLALREGAEGILAEMRGDDAYRSSDAFRSRIRELNRLFIDLQGMLGEYRHDLRRGLSISFSDSWRRLTEKIAYRCAQEGIGMESDFPAGFETVRIHLKEGEFEHIFMNCFENSMWALRDAAKKTLRVEVALDKANLSLRWMDTGRGIPAGVRDDLFKRTVSPQRPGGSGSGCYLSAQIILARGGVIRLDQPPGDWASCIFMKFIRTE
jgi:signal transduction histidine kinase